MRRLLNEDQRRIIRMSWWQFSRVIPWCIVCATVSVWRGEKTGVILLLAGMPFLIWRYRRWCMRQGIDV